MKNTLISGNHVQITIGAVNIRRTSWKHKDYIITSGCVRYELIDRCIKHFDSAGVAECDYYFDSTEHLHVEPNNDTRLHFDA